MRYTSGIIRLHDISEEGQDRECDGLGEHDDGVGDTRAQLVAIRSDDEQLRRQGVIEWVRSQHQWVPLPSVQDRKYNFCRLRECADAPIGS